MQIPKISVNKKCNRWVEKGEKSLNDLIMVRVELELGLWWVGVGAGNICTGREERIEVLLRKDRWCDPGKSKLFRTSSLVRLSSLGEQRLTTTGIVTLG